MGRLYILPIHEWLFSMVQVNIQSSHGSYGYRLINFYESRLVIVFCILWSWWICVMLKLCESILNMPILSSLMSACWCLHKIHKKAITTLSEVLLWCTLQETRKHIPPNRVSAGKSSTQNCLAFRDMLDLPLEGNSINDLLIPPSFSSSWCFNCAIWASRVSTSFFKRSWGFGIRFPVTWCGGC